MNSTLAVPTVKDLMPGSGPGSARSGVHRSSGYIFAIPHSAMGNPAILSKKIHVLTLHQMIIDIQLLLDCAEGGQHESEVIGLLRTSR